MIIDSHQHAFWQGRDDAGLVADMDLQGIDLAWLLTWEIPPFPQYADATSWAKALNPARVRPDGTHPGILLDDLLIAHRNYPGRFLLGYCPDPAKPNASELFEAACEMHGVRVCGEWKFRMPFDDPRCIELFQAAGRRKAPVVLHLDVPYLPPDGGSYMSAWYGGTIANLERAMESCPDTIFVGHAPGFWREISADADTTVDQYPQGPIVRGGQIERLFEKFPNLSADLSANSALVALKRDTGFSREFLQRFDDRLLFARDYYGGNLQELLCTLDLSDQTLQKILSGNALRLVPPTQGR